MARTLDRRYGRSLLRMGRGDSPLSWKGSRQTSQEDEALTSNIAKTDGEANTPEWETGGALEHALLVLLWSRGTDRLASVLGRRAREWPYNPK